MSYEAASRHFISWFQMRNNVTLVFLTAIGAIFGVAFGGEDMLRVLLSIPFISLGCSFLIAHHNVMLGSLLDFNSKEIPIDLNSDSDVRVPQYENSKSLKKYFKLALSLMTWGQIVILFLPSLFSLTINYSDLYSTELSNQLIWWFAFLCFGAGIVMIIVIHVSQTKQIKHLK